MQFQHPSSRCVRRAIVFVLALLAPAVLSACAGFELPTAPRGNVPYVGASCSGGTGRRIDEREANRDRIDARETGRCRPGGSRANAKRLK
jgi:hypothetical protein